MSTKQSIELQTRLTREDVAGVLEAIVDGLKEGCLKVQKSDATLELVVPRVVDLEIEAKLTDERAKFEIEVSWRTNRVELADIPEEPLSIPTAPKAKKEAKPAKSDKNLREKKKQEKPEKKRKDI